MTSIILLSGEAHGECHCVDEQERDYVDAVHGCFSFVFVRLSKACSSNHRFCPRKPKAGLEGGPCSSQRLSSPTPRGLCSPVRHKGSDKALLMCAVGVHDDRVKRSGRKAITHVEDLCATGRIAGAGEASYPGFQQDSP